MDDVELHVADTLDDSGRRFIDAWRHAEANGEIKAERHISFDTFETMVEVLSPKRLSLLRDLRRGPARSVAALARALGRDYKRVHSDVAALRRAGLIEGGTAGNELTVPYGVIRSSITL